MEAIRSDPGQLFFWENLTQPVVVGRRFNHRLFIARNHLWTSNVQNTVVESECHYLRMRFIGIVQTAPDFPVPLHHSRVKLDQQGHGRSSQMRQQLTMPRLSTSTTPSQAGSTVSHTDSVRSVPSDLRRSSLTPSPSARSVRSARSARSDASPGAASDVSGHGVNLGNAGSPTFTLKWRDPFCEELHRVWYPHDPAHWSSVPRSLGDQCQCFCYSEPVDFRITLTPPTSDSSEYLSFFSFGYIPSSLPPSYDSSSIRFAYILSAAVVEYQRPPTQFEQDMPFKTLITFLHTVDVLGSAKSWIRPSEIMKDFIHFEPVHRYSFPPPPLFPPVPTTLSSPCSSMFHRMMGGGVGNSYEPPVAIPFGLIGDHEPERIRELIRRADPGYQYVEWVMSLITDFAGNQGQPSLHQCFRTHGCGTSLLTHFLDQSSIEKANSAIGNIARAKDHGPKAENWLIKILGAELVKELMEPPAADGFPSFVEERLPPSQEDLLGPPHFPSVIVPSDIDLEKLDRLRTLWWRFGDVNHSEWSYEKDFGNFLSKSEAAGVEDLRPKKAVFRVSIRDKFVCDMMIEGAIPLSIDDVEYLDTRYRDYSQTARLGVLTEQSTRLVTRPGGKISITLNFARSPVTVLEVDVRIIATQIVTQPPLSCTESLNWVYQRSAMAKRAMTRRRSSSPAKYSESHDRPRSPSLQTLIRKDTQVVHHDLHSVLQYETCTLEVHVPTDLPHSFSTELISLQYSMEVEFLCVGHHGKLLELQSEGAAGVFAAPESPKPGTPTASRPSLPPRTSARRSSSSQRSSNSLSRQVTSSHREGAGSGGGAVKALFRMLSLVPTDKAPPRLTSSVAPQCKQLSTPSTASLHAVRSQSSLQASPNHNVTHVFTYGPGEPSGVAAPCQTDKEKSFATASSLTRAGPSSRACSTAVSPTRPLSTPVSFDRYSSPESPDNPDVTVASNEIGGVSSITHQESSLHVPCSEATPTGQDMNHLVATSPLFLGSDDVRGPQFSLTSGECHVAVPLTPKAQNPIVPVPPSAKTSEGVKPPSSSAPPIQLSLPQLSMDATTRLNRGQASDGSEDLLGGKERNNLCSPDHCGETAVPERTGSAPSPQDFVDKGTPRGFRTRGFLMLAEHVAAAPEAEPVSPAPDSHGLGHGRSHLPVRSFTYQPSSSVSAPGPASMVGSPPSNGSGKGAASESNPMGSTPEPSSAIAEPRSGCASFLVLNGPVAPHHTIGAKWTAALLLAPTTLAKEWEDIYDLAQEQTQMSRIEIESRLKAKKLVTDGIAGRQLPLRRLEFRFSGTAGPADDTLEPGIPSSTPRAAQETPKRPSR